MDIYRFIVSTGDQELPAVAAAESEEAAFQIVEREVKHNFLKKLNVTEIALVEKRKIRSKGAGYLLSPREIYE